MSRLVVVVSLLVLFCFLGLGIPVAGEAGETSYRASGVVSITGPQQRSTDLGSLIIQLEPIKQGKHSALVALPPNYSIVSPGVIQAKEDTLVNLETALTGQSNEFRIAIDYQKEAKNLTFVIPIRTTIPEKETGDILVSITRFEGQLTNGSVVIGRIATGQVKITSLPSKAKSVTPGAELPFTINVSEEKQAVLREGTETLSFLLPESFSWQSSTLKVDVIASGGYELVARVDPSNTQLLLVDVKADGEMRSSGSFKLSGYLVANRTLRPTVPVRVQASGPDLITPVQVVLAQIVEPDYEAHFAVGRSSYFFNGHVLTMDVVPFLKSGRVFVPLRYVGLSLGVQPDDIKWDGRFASLSNHGKMIRVEPGSKQLRVNGAIVEMDVEAEFSNGRVMLPYRFIAEAFGADVEWRSTDQTVIMLI